MIDRYKYIHFVKVEDKPKTSVWECRNNRSEGTLGIVKWYSPWRQYCFFTQSLSERYEIVLNTSCLKDICHFMEQLR